jgi:hypothetical protein
VNTGVRMAGYSGTPLPKKLGIKEGHRVALVGAPEGFALDDSEMPDSAVVQRSAAGRGPLDVVLLFVRSERELRTKFGKLAARLSPAGGLWIAWPKKTSGVVTDLSENPIRDIGLAAGLVDNKVCAVDEVWSGLRFVKRLKDR